MIKDNHLVLGVYGNWTNCEYHPIPGWLEGLVVIDKAAAKLLPSSPNCMDA